jgi:DNA (cytosine-5)-methyltransferase 1
VSYLRAASYQSSTLRRAGGILDLGLAPSTDALTGADAAARTAQLSKQATPLRPSLPLDVVSLFSGIGGFELGFLRGGHRTVLLCDCDNAARAVLKHRFQQVELVGEIGDLDRLPSHCDVLCAGFPCQNLSMAGDKKGITGGKSSLVNEVFRLLEHSHPSWLIFENVTFMLHLDRGSAMEHIISEFERRSMNWAYRVLDTYWFGLPQRRRRVFFVASTRGNARDCLLSDEGLCAVPPRLSLTLDRPIGFYWTEGRSGVGLIQDAIPPLKAGSGLGIPSAPAVLFPDGAIETPTVQEAERLQGFPPDWTVAADEINPRARWKLVGNAVSVPVAEWLGRRLVYPQAYDGSKDRPIIAGGPWPKAAWGSNGKRFASSASENPLRAPNPSLQAFANRPWRPLSNKALQGFYSRADTKQLNFPDGFLQALAVRLASNQASAKTSATPSATR